MVVIIVVMVMVVMMLVLILVIIIVVIVVVMMVSLALFALTVLIVVMVVMLVLMLFGFEKSGSHVGSGKRLFDSLEDLNSGEIIPGCSDDLGMIVDGTDEFDRLVELLLGDIARTAQYDRSGVLDLVLIELLEVLEVDPALGSVNDCNCSADLSAFNALDCGYNVRKLAYARRFDEDPVR